MTVLHLLKNMSRCVLSVKLNALLKIMQLDFNSQYSDLYSSVPDSELSPVGQTAFDKGNFEFPLKGVK